jgi:RND family efflux transporter MFP subunit
MIEIAKMSKLAKINFNQYHRYLGNILVVGIAIIASSCTPKEAADAQSQQQNRPTAVDVGNSKTETLTPSPTYMGGTEPIRTVSMRSQVEGQLLGLNVDVGDFVKQGQIVAQLDDSILRTQLKAAEAELAALKSEVARSNSQVSNARAQVESTRLELTQAQADSQRQQSLLREGAIASQTAQQTQTEARTAAQTLRAAVQTVTTEQQAVAAAQGRVIAQQAVVAQEQKRRSYTRLIAPNSGIVLQRLQEPGDLIQPGNEVLQIADFSRIQVRVEVSDKQLGNISIGQSISVKLDAFPQETLSGQVTRIYPADATARLVPIEVVIPNSNGKIGSGLLARVSFISSNQEFIVVPQSALGGGQREQTGQEESNTGTVFIITQEAESKAKVVARPVTLGDRADGKVEILSGLKVGKRYVTASSKPLKNGETVNLSILSRKPVPKGE